MFIWLAARYAEDIQPNLSRMPGEAGKRPTNRQRAAPVKVAKRTSAPAKGDVGSELPKAKGRGGATGRAVGGSGVAGMNWTEDFAEWADERPLRGYLLTGIGFALATAIEIWLRP